MQSLKQWNELWGEGKRVTWSYNVYEFLRQTKHREMIELVMKEVGKLGVKSQSLFVVNDLYEPKNMT